MGDRAVSKHPTKGEAEGTALDVARKEKVEHVIHKQNGKIGERNTYRPKDPRERSGSALCRSDDPRALDDPNPPL